MVSKWQQYLVSGVYVLGEAGVEHGAHQQRVRLVADAEHVVGADVAEALRRALQVVERGAQVALRREHHRAHALFRVRQLLLLTHFYYLKTFLFLNTLYG